MTLLTFFIAAIVLAITPGPGIAYVVARTAAGGRSEGLASCFGTGIGGMLHVLAAALGLSLLIAQSALAFSLVKYVGAAYLVFLGLRLLLRKQEAPAIDAIPAQGVRRALFEGIVVEALNVKTALFFKGPQHRVGTSRREWADELDGLAGVGLCMRRHDNTCRGDQADEDRREKTAIHDGVVLLS